MITTYLNNTDYETVHDTGAVKKEIDDLAIFGGSRAFKEKLHVGRPNIGNRQRLLARINEILDRRWLTNDGPCVQDFEHQIAEMTGVKHCVAVSNATVGLEIAIRALGLTGEVIVPSMTFVATAHALQWQEITPVFCDIDPDTLTIDPARVEQMITPRTTGIIGVHLWSRACDIEALTEVARRRNLKLLFDAAHAFGCSYKGRMIGNFGDAEVFSFHATKFLNTFEGGLIATNNSVLAEKSRLMRNFGFAGIDNVIYIGTNGKMNELSAAMGLTSLEAIDEFVDVNYRNYQQYRRELADLPGIRLVPYDEAEKNNFQYIILEIDPAQTQLTRDQLAFILWGENILVRRYFYPGCHRMEPYRSYYPHAGLLLPETEKAVERVLTLPTGTAIGPREVSIICQVIRVALTQVSEVAERLQQLNAYQIAMEVAQT